MHRVVALVQAFGGDVAAVVDDVQIIARAAGHAVGAQATVQAVVAGVAHQDVGQLIARGVEVGIAQQGEVLEVGAQGCAEAGADGVVAFVGEFGHHVVQAVDHIGVIARATFQGVVAAAAVQGVVGAVAQDQVVQAVAGAVNRFSALQTELFHVVGQRRADTGVDHVDSRIAGFHHQVIGVVDDVGVIAQATLQGVATFFAVEQVVALVAHQQVGQGVAGAAEVGGPGQGEVVDMVAQGQAQGGHDGVIAFAAGFLHHVGGVVHPVGVVTAAAHHQVGASTPVNEVGTGVADDRVVQLIARGIDGASAGQGQVFEVGPQGPGDAAAHGVSAVAAAFNHLVA